MLGFIWTLIIGLIVGAMAKLIMPGPDRGGVFVTMLLGVTGAVVAGFVSMLLGLDASGQTSAIMSTLGAVLLLMLHRLVSHRHSSV